MSSHTRHARTAASAARTPAAPDDGGGNRWPRSAVLARNMRDAADGLAILRQLGVMPRMRHPNRRGKNASR